MSEQIYVGADHAGFQLKQKLVDELQRLGYEPVDVGPKTMDPADDYPDYGRPVAAAVSEGKAARGVLTCGTGLGMTYIANRFPHVRAAVAWTPEIAELARKHNDANVQPHSGAQANMAAYLAVAKPGDTLLGLALPHGGHLTHGAPVNFSGTLFRATHYGVHEDTGRIDYDQVRDIARRERPRILIGGGSAYARIIEFATLRSIAEEVGATFVVDMAHFAGLVAAGIHPSPVPHAHIVTTTTHKTLRGPRGGLILCQEAFAKDVDKQVFPGIQGGPLEHVIAAKAVALGEALNPEFKEYATQVVRNAQALAAALVERGYAIVSGGTDTHLMLVDLRSKQVTGKDAQELLDRAGITVNKNTIPGDPQKAFVTSGIRIGTPAVTTRGFTETEMLKVADFIDTVLTKRDDATIARVRADVRDLAERFPLYAAPPPPSPVRPAVAGHHAR